MSFGILSTCLPQCSRSLRGAVKENATTNLKTRTTTTTKQGSEQFSFSFHAAKTRDKMEQEMQIAVVVSKGGEVKVCETAMPQPRAGEALVKVLRAGICNTDLEIIKGYMGFEGVLGHEFVGRVVEVNAEEAVKKRWQGKRVVGDINLCCRNVKSCATCRRGDDVARNHCPSRTVLGILGKDGCQAVRFERGERKSHRLRVLVPSLLAPDLTALDFTPLPPSPILPQPVHSRAIVLSLWPTSTSFQNL